MAMKKSGRLTHAPVGTNLGNIVSSGRHQARGRLVDSIHPQCPEEANAWRQRVDEGFVGVGWPEVEG